ncbi:hypothetical protein ACRALDRAFT_2095766 [Sodiomyces alcalophilus JCM 7366]|uniref:uncharacterized protein n=1 Tax=Sodiomyces alcalophilus JCM 7366 TaxID=591952 RepID=UPI0039B6AE89
MRINGLALLALLGVVTRTGADPTWPSSIDEVEEIMFQIASTRSRKFADSVNPCTSQASGPGRHSAAEWLRTAFHDMATAHVFQGLGGLDASLQYELSNGENAGPGFATTLTWMAPYLSRRSSMADLIALGVYTSVRACGGPAVPIRAGRVDAVQGGSPGVPQPQNAIGIFRNQFQRMGFTSEEMVQLTACGHTLGGVHSSQFPDIVPPGTRPNDHAPFDSTVAVFDDRIVTDYLNGTTQNPLVVGPAVRINKHSDFKLFNSDANATISAMAGASTFREICRTVLQKMIDTVPPGVTLGEPITPYQVKPVQLQLTLSPQLGALDFTGYIRVRTTEMPLDTIEGLTINYRNRNGGSECGSGPCSFSLSVQGVGRGFDDTFAWFPIARQLPVSSGISSFTVTIRRTDGTSLLVDNNGNGYPLQDGVFLQRYQSCILATSGTTTLSAAVRNDRADLPVKAVISYKTPQTGSVVPALNNMTLELTKGPCVGSYTLFSASTTIPGGLSVEADFDIISGEGSSALVDYFKKANILGGACQSFPQTGSCTTPSSTSSSSETPASTDSIESNTASSTTSSTVPTESPHHREVIGEYRLVSCWTEGDGVRALSGASFAYDSMTLESCMANCTGFDYWGTEYGRECYCGNSLHGSTSSAPLDECDMACGGDDTQYCGSGNRLELYSTTATRSSSATSSAPTPTETPVRLPMVSDYAHVGCQTEGVGVRALQGPVLVDDDMTLDMCADFCSNYVYFGTEYGRECYCGNSLHSSSEPAPLEECGMTCAGNPFQYCGAGNRIELYRANTPSMVVPTPTDSSSWASTSSTQESSTTTMTEANPSHRPTVTPYMLVGCQTEGTGARALDGPSYASGTEMTLEACAEFCEGYRYFGTQYSAECFCGNRLHDTSLPAPLSECPMLCSGNPSEYCGGPDRLTLYRNDDIPSEEPDPEPRQPAFAGDDFVWLGCWTEPVAAGARALDGPTTASDDMSNEVCAEFCDGFAYFGTEYGRECFCGDEIHEGSEELDEEECNMRCSGARDEFCGNSNRLSVYARDEDADTES